MRKEFNIEILFNGKKCKPIIIDSHFSKSHPDISFKLILKLVASLDGSFFDPQKVSPDGFQYFAIEPVFHQKAPYRLVLVTHKSQRFLGVINAFRVSRKKHEK